MQGFIVLLLIWGTVFFSLLNTLPAANLASSGGGLAAVLNNINVSLTEHKDVFAILNKDGDFETSIVHFPGKPDINDVAFSPGDSNVAFAATNSGVFVSRDSGINWRQFSDSEKKISEGAKVYKIKFVSLNSSQNIFLSAYQFGKGYIYRSRDNLFSVEEIFEIEGEAVYDFEIVNSTVYLAMSDGRIFVGDLNKKQFRLWKDLEKPILQLKVYNSGSLIYVALKSGGLLVSENGGSSFSERKFLDRYEGAEQIKKLMTAPRSPYLAYAATAYGLIRSLDAGRNWQVFKTLPSEEKSVSAVCVNFPNSEIYAASNSKIFKSVDGGLNWQIFIPQISKREISLVAENNGKIIIGTRKKSFLNL